LAKCYDDFGLNIVTVPNVKQPLFLCSFLQFIFIGLNVCVYFLNKVVNVGHIIDSLGKSLKSFD